MNGLATSGRWSTPRRIARNARIDMHFGLPLAFAYVRNRKQSNSDYVDLEAIFENSIKAGDVLVDVGCGAGRVINQWLRMGLENSIYGLEIDNRLGATTRRRLRRFENVEIIIGDAVANLPSDGTVFFLFNPFDRDTVRRFADAITDTAANADGAITILYLNCKHVDVFQDDPTFDVDIEQLNGASAGSGQSLATVTLRSRRSR